MAAAGTGFPATPYTTDERDTERLLPRLLHAEPG